MKRENNYKSGKSARRIEIKREQAFERQEIYNNLSVADRIRRAKTRRGESKSEISRLQKLEKKS